MNGGVSRTKCPYPRCHWDLRGKLAAFRASGTSSSRKAAATCRGARRRAGWLRFTQPGRQRAAADRLPRRAAAHFREYPSSARLIVAHCSVGCRRTGRSRRKPSWSRCTHVTHPQILTFTGEATASTTVRRQHQPQRHGWRLPCSHTKGVVEPLVLHDHSKSPEGAGLDRAAPHCRRADERQYIGELQTQDLRAFGRDDSRMDAARSAGRDPVFDLPNTRSGQAPAATSSTA